MLLLAQIKLIVYFSAMEMPSRIRKKGYNENIGREIIKES